jgi:CRP-like cAMP-binding protein
MDSKTEVDRYVLDTLMRDLVGHDRRTSSYLVYLFILGAGAGRPVVLSHQQLSAGAGLSKRAVQDAIAHLVRRGLLAVDRRARTEPAALTPLAPWSDQRL